MKGETKLLFFCLICCISRGSHGSTCTTDRQLEGHLAALVDDIRVIVNDYNTRIERLEDQAKPCTGTSSGGFPIRPKMPVVHRRSSAGTYKLSWDAAKALCWKYGETLATVDQLEAAWRKDLDVCACGWLADGSVRYPIIKPRKGCGTGAAGLRVCSNAPTSKLYDVYCSTSPLPVVHRRSASGTYKLSSYGAAQEECHKYGQHLATQAQLEKAWRNGYDACACGWLADGSVQYPINNPRNGCGNGAAGLRICSAAPASGSYDAYCSTNPVPVEHHRSPAGTYKLSSWNNAKEECKKYGQHLATRAQLEKAWRNGYDVCACGWLADGSVQYPINNPRNGCGNGAAGLRICSHAPANGSYDVYCSVEKAPVVHRQSPQGSYKITSLEAAWAECEKYGQELATEAQMQAAWRMGYDMCACGWLADGSIRYPITNPRKGCGTNSAGLRTCGNQGADVYCSAE